MPPLPSSRLFRVFNAVAALALAFDSLAAHAAAAVLKAPSSESSAKSSGDYFGATPPGNKPELFAPGQVSRPDRFAARIAFSTDLKECYLTETDATFSHPHLLFARRDQDHWTSFAPAPFAAKFKVSQEPFVSRDNQRLYFTADGDDAVPGNTRDIWFVKREGSGWGEPIRLPGPINSPSTEYFFSQATDGTIVFASDRPGGLGNSDLYSATTDSTGAVTVKNLGAGVNSAGWEFDPCILPDGQILVFSSARNGSNNLDIYISHRRGDTWSTAVPLGGDINTPANEYGSTLSPDGRYLFFVRHDGKHSDVYWMSTAGLSNI